MFIFRKYTVTLACLADAAAAATDFAVSWTILSHFDVFGRIYHS